MLTEAEAAEGRLWHLLAKRHTTRANYEVAHKNLRSAEAKLDTAKTAMKMAKDQLGYAEVRADVDGVVTAVSAGPGTGRQHAPKAAGATSFNVYLGQPYRQPAV